MLEKRSTEREFTEHRTCDEAVAAQAYRGMATFNRWGGGIAVVRDFVEFEVSRVPAGRPLRVLDIGSGSCDIPLAVSRWAKARGFAVEFTCVDYSDTAVRLGWENIAKSGDLQVRMGQGDIFEYQSEEPFDCAVGSMFFHHFTDDEIIRLVNRLRSIVRHSLLISDLLRYTPYYLIAWLGSLVLPTELRHDVRVSIKRGFKLTELRHLFRDMDGVSVTVSRDRMFRALAVVRFPGTGS